MKIPLIIWYISEGELLVLLNSVINSTYPDVSQM